MLRGATFKQVGEGSEMLSTLEKQSSSSDIELQPTQDELAKELNELKSAEMPNAQARGELSYFRRLVDDLNLRLNEAIDNSKKDRLRANRMEIACFTAADDWRVELEAMQKQYQVEISCLKKENEDLEREVVGASKAKAAALTMARDAMLASEVATKKVESLSVDLKKAMEATVVARQETLECRQLIDELSRQKTAISEAYAACQKSAQAGAAIVAEKEADLKKYISALFQAKQQAEILRWELFESRKNETRLCEMSNELEIITKQLVMAKQTEEEQAKVVMDKDAKLQEVLHEIQQARAAKDEVATLLNSAQSELEGNQQKWIVASTEASALTTYVESMKNELETQQMQIRMLQGRNAESEAKLSGASEKLADNLASEQEKNEALNYLACSFEVAKVESEFLRQQIYETVFEAQFNEVEMTKDLMLIHMVLKSAECMASKARADLQDIFHELRLERELALLSSSLSDSSKSSLRIMMGSSQSVMKESDEASEMDAPSLSVDLALAACKPAALRIAFDLRVIGAQLDRIREEAEMIVAATSELNDHPYGIEQARPETLAQPDEARGEVSTTIAKANEFQGNVKRERALDGNAETQGKFREFLEPWELVDSGSETTLTIKKEEYDSLKLKVREAMEMKSLDESQLLSLRTSNQRLSTQLDATNMEIKALRLSEQSMFQQYDKLQQRNMILEAETHNLKGKSEQFLKSWEVGHESLGVDAITLPMKVDKKQHTSSSLSISRDLSPSLSISRDLSSSEKEEEESTEFLSLSTKKKKKALYLRIGTFLTKKMN